MNRPPRPHADVDAILFDEAAIARRVEEIAAAVNAAQDGRELTVVGVLTGACAFTADLIRRLDMPMLLDFIAVSSYGQSTTTSGVVRLNKDLDIPLEGRDVLVVEDIVDTGLTLQYLRENLLARRPRSLRIAVLLDKRSRRQVEVPVDYIGFEIPDVFVVGYGIDYAGRYRNLPYVATLKPEVYS
ncbi:MAG: hypoxanthine phosphoribosyltransferase [Firmicutes bacterium]|nr:hypoxanthine phosphoribosyltransferase [Bacillota bacterium]